MPLFRLIDQVVSFLVDISALAEEVTGAYSPHPVLVYFPAQAKIVYTCCIVCPEVQAGGKFITGSDIHTYVEHFQRITLHNPGMEIPYKRRVVLGALRMIYIPPTDDVRCRSAEAKKETALALHTCLEEYINRKIDIVYRQGLLYCLIQAIAGVE